MPVSLPRPALLGLVGIVLVFAVFLATRGGGGDEGAAPANSPAPALSSQEQLKQQQSAKNSQSDKPATSKQPEGKTAKAANQNDAGKVIGLPGPVAKALGEKKVVVLFFTQRGPADDTATRRSVAYLRRAGGPVAVFTDSIKRIERYRRIVAELGVAQAPAIVIVDRERRASLHEGYLEKASLRQLVRDARR